MQTSYSQHTRNSAKQAVKACCESDNKSTEDGNKRIQDDMKRIASKNNIKPTIQRSQSSEQSL